MFCIMLMLFARITYCDNQEFPLSKGITFGAAIPFLFLSGFVSKAVTEVGIGRRTYYKAIEEGRI